MAPPQFQLASQLSDQEQKERDIWGKNLNGYLGGGNFEDNPDLNQYTLRKYVKLKNEGQLSKITKLEDSKEHSMFLADGQSSLYSDDNFNNNHKSDILLPEHKLSALQKKNIHQQRKNYSKSQFQSKVQNSVQKHPYPNINSKDSY